MAREVVRGDGSGRSDDRPARSGTWSAAWAPQLDDEPGSGAQFCAHVRGQILGLAGPPVPDLVGFPAVVPVVVGVEFVLPGDVPEAVTPERELGAIVGCEGDDVR
ncbi:MAG TPA: hypothetical protein VGA04_10045 [Streptosporangiaceae bacterium]